jgi:uracil-DNA glycosylase
MMTREPATALLADIRACTVCAAHLPARPRPIVQFGGTSRILIIGQAPGASGDLPPRPECAPLWHARVLAALPADRFTILVGSYAQARYLPGTKRQSLTERVRDVRAHLPAFLSLPHPSWRSTGWMTKNPWFATEVLPALRDAVVAATATARTRARPR